MKFLILVFILITIPYSNSFMQSISKDSAIYKDKNASVEDRVTDLLSRMTIKEKIDMLGGTGFETKSIDRLGIPPLNMADGPLGVRWDKSTALPSGILLGATWNPKIVSEFGKVLAIETKAKGRQVILAPCINIARIPMGGRNFESFGEDPYLTSRITVSYIKGVQSENVVATVKHFAVNNQEYQRDFVNVVIDERSLNEIYLPAFKAAVEEANVLAIMSAYNKLNGHFCSENDYLLIDKLKSEWKFNGLVMSDWGAVHSSVPTFNGGLDLEMPTGKYLNIDSLLTKINEDKLSEEKLNNKVQRILRVMFTIGLFDNYKYDSTQVNTDEHKKVALNVAKEGIVLLKNNNSILPLNLDKIKSIAIIGPTSDLAITGGGGSSMVEPSNPISPIIALQNKIGNKVKINFAKGLMLDGDSNPIDSKFLFTNKDGNENGLTAEYYSNMNLEGNPQKISIDKIIDFSWNSNAPFENFPKDNFSVRWTGYIKVEQTDRYTLDVASDDGVRMYFDDELVINDWNDHALMTNAHTVSLVAGKFYKIKLEYYENKGGAIVKFGWRKPNDDLIIDAINAAKNSDIAIVFVGTNNNYESEGFDRKNLILPDGQDDLIKQVSEVNENTIVVLTTGSPVLMNDWIEKIDGLIEAWFAGEQVGNAIADILLGETNPSGKLPISFPKRWEDCSAYNSYLKEDAITRYEDGIYVGYRHFDQYSIKPLFPFGFGLSYTTFEYSDLEIPNTFMKGNDTITLRCKIKNTGNVTGQEVVQLYISDPVSTIKRPKKELKNFKKIFLKSGEEQIVEFTIDSKALSYFNPTTRSWVAEPGDYQVLIGSSSEDIKLAGTISLDQ